MIDSLIRKTRILIYKMFKKNIQVDYSASIDKNCEIEGRDGIIDVSNTYFRSGARIYVRNGGEIKFGKNVFVNHNCIMYSRGSIYIGDNVQIGPNVVIYDHDHFFSSKEVKKDSFNVSPIYIGEGTWIGANVTILKGVNIGDHCVIAAGSVIVKNIPPKSIVYDKRTQVINSL